MINLFFIGAGRNFGEQNLAFLIYPEIPCIMYDWGLQAKLFSMLQWTGRVAL